MLETKDFVSGFIGLLLFCVGLLPILNKASIGPSWFSLSFLPVQVFAYVVAITGFYLIIESFIEITNSNAIGWWSFIIAAVIMTLGILKVLNTFAIGPSWFSFPWLSASIYYIIFTIEGLFLMIAMFAMEI